MSKRPRVIELVKELLELEARMAQKEAELDELLDGKAGPKPAAWTGSPRDRILKCMGANPGRPMTTAGICEVTGCSTHIFTYYVRLLIEEGLVKRVKRGHYQLRGRKS